MKVHSYIGVHPCCISGIMWRYYFVCVLNVSLLMCSARYKYLLLDPVCHIGLQDINITWGFFSYWWWWGEWRLFQALNLQASLSRNYPEIECQIFFYVLQPFSGVYTVRMPVMQFRLLCSLLFQCLCMHVWVYYSTDSQFQLFFDLGLGWRLGQGYGWCIVVCLDFDCKGQKWEGTTSWGPWKFWLCFCQIFIEILKKLYFYKYIFWF